MEKNIEYLLDGKEFATSDSCLSGGINMNRITVFMENAENSRLLKDWLLGKYDVTIADIGNPLNGPFDLGILDGPALQKLWSQIEARRKSEEPAFLPFLLVTPGGGGDGETLVAIELFLSLFQEQIVDLWNLPVGLCRRGRLRQCLKQNLPVGFCGRTTSST